MSILDVVQEEAERRGGCRVEAIHLKIGALSGVVPKALLSAYELARENTEFENCRLVIEDVPVIAYCPNCQVERPIRSLSWLRCAECDTPVSDLRQGRELQVSALELAE
jgi:hydrogenase nickel incorporation protein HypA/HybF